MDPKGGGDHLGWRCGRRAGRARGERSRVPCEEVEPLLGTKGFFKQGNDRIRFVSLDNPGGRG